MEKKELELALESYGKDIQAKQAELQKAIEANMEAKAVELKKSVDDMELLRKEMQKQLDDQNIELQKMKVNPSQKTITFASELKELLIKDIKKLSGLKEKGVAGMIFEVKSFLESANASITTGSLLPVYQYEPGVSKAPDRMPFMMDIVTTAVANSLTIFYTQRKTRTDNSGWVTEGTKTTLGGGAVTQSVLGYETKTAVMQNLSEFIKVSNNSIDDIDWLLSEIQTELLTLIMLKIDAALLTGTVAVNGFDGVLTVATAFNAGGDALPTGVTPNKFDALAFAIAQIQIAKFMPNFIVLHPADVRDMKLTRDDRGAYLLPPTMAAGGLSVDGIRVISNTGMTKGSYLVGDFTKAKFWMRKGVDIRIWEQNDTDAEDQLKTITGYMRGTLVVKDADKLAFVTDTFTDTITEITAV